MPIGPANLTELKAVKSATERAIAAGAYITAREEAIAEARKVRDDAVRAVAAEVGPTKAAQACGVSLSLVKVVTRR